MITALLVTIVLAVAACNPPGDGNTAGTTPPPTIATVPATTPAATPPPTVAAVYQPATENGPAQNVPVPVLPPKAKEFSKEGLLAFAEYWYSTLGYVFETGDSKPMMMVSAPDCPTCTFINAPVSDWYRDRGWIVGGTMTVLQSTSPFAETSKGTYQAILLVRQDKVSYYAADGTLADAHPQSIAKTNLVEASYVDGGWIAHTAEILKTS
ncbi:DUF6318 family protein [Arthrobacter psychrolactophilus]